MWGVSIRNPFQPFSGSQAGSLILQTHGWSFNLIIRLGSMTTTLSSRPLLSMKQGGSFDIQSAMPYPEQVTKVKDASYV